MTLMAGLALVAVTVVSGSASTALKCSLVSRAVISSALDQRLVSSRSAAVRIGGTSCAYFGANGGRPLVLVNYQVGVTPATFANSFASSGNPGSSGNHRVSGIANGAYYFRGPPFGIALTVLDGKTVFEIQANASLARIEALAKKIAPRARS